MDDRGVSDVLGYLLTFSLVITTIFLLFGTGVAQLGGLQDAAQVNNAERAFSVLYDSFEDIHQQGAPSRAVEIQLSGASLSIASQTTFQIGIDGGSTCTLASPCDVDLNPIVYEKGSQAVVYENGAVIRESGEGSVMLKEPPMYFDSDRTVLSQTVTQGPQNTISGDTAALVVGKRTSQSIVDGNSGSGLTVSIEVNSPRAAAWKRYLEANLPGGFTTVDGNPDDGDVAYEFQTDRVLFRQTLIETELRS